MGPMSLQNLFAVFLLLMRALSLFAQNKPNLTLDDFFVAVSFPTSPVRSVSGSTKGVYGISDPSRMASGFADYFGAFY